MTDGLRAVWSAKKIIWWANIENWYLFQYEWNVRRGLSSLCTMHLIIFWGFVSSDFIQKEDMILMIEWWFSPQVLIISAHQTNFFVKKYCNAMIVNAVLTAYHVIMSMSWFEFLHLPRFVFVYCLQFLMIGTSFLHQRIISIVNVWVSYCL